MSWVATAVVAAAAIGAGATVYASDQSSNAITGSTNASINAQESAQQRQQAVEQPYNALGTSAIQQYKNLLGLGPGGAAGEQATLAATPGYQFAKTQGLTSTENAATAMGLGLSGNSLEALDTFSTGLADSTYQNAVGNAQNAVTIGQNAASTTGAGILNTGANVGGAISAAGQNIAGIDANAAAGVTKALSGGVSNYITANTLANLGPSYTGSTAGLGYDYGNATGLAPAGGG